MKVTENQVRTFTLEMSEEEAAWLKEVMQNTLHDQHPDDEDVNDRINRLTFFTTLADAI